jgi:hypothetical protein
MKPNHVSQPSFEKVRMDEQSVIRIVDATAKMTVQAEWSDSALKAVAVVTMPAAETRTWAIMIMAPTISRPVRPQTWPNMSDVHRINRWPLTVTLRMIVFKVAQNKSCIYTRPDQPDIFRY